MRAQAVVGGAFLFVAGAVVGWASAVVTPAQMHLGIAAGFIILAVLAIWWAWYFAWHLSLKVAGAALVVLAAGYGSYRVAPAPPGPATFYIGTANLHRERASAIDDHYRVAVVFQSTSDSDLDSAGYMQSGFAGELTEDQIVAAVRVVRQAALAGALSPEARVGITPAHESSTATFYSIPILREVLNEAQHGEAIFFFDVVIVNKQTGEQHEFCGYYRGKGIERCPF